VTKPLDPNPLRCQSRHPDKGWQCGLHRGHHGSHTGLVVSQFSRPETDGDNDPDQMLNDGDTAEP